MNLRFLIISIILFFIIIVSEYIAYASLHHVELIKSTKLEMTLMVLGVILPVLFIISMIYGYKNYSSFNSAINTVSSIWLGLVFYIFISSLIIFILIMVNHYFGLNIPIRNITYILIVLTISILIYGIINASKPKIVTWEISSSQLSKDWYNKKIILISDIHLGNIRTDKFLRKIINSISKEKPDLVVISGDLIDGPSIPYSKWLSEFSKISPEYGILYVEGNHEKYNQEYDKFKSQIPSYIENITNKKIIKNNTQFIGLDYKENNNKEDIYDQLDILNYEPSKSSIILMHDPKDTKKLAEKNVSLVLSGHTHSGQFFPFTIAVNKLYKTYSHNISYTKNTASVTSSGVGTSIIPIRIGTKPEIVILNIK